MALLPAQFVENVPQNDEIQSDYSPIPKGEYNAQVVGSEVILTRKAREAEKQGVPNFAELGQILVLKFSIIDGAQKGRFFWVRLNIVNESPVAVEIAHQQFAKIRKAAGMSFAQDSSELHLKPMTVVLDIDDRDSNYAPSTIVKSYKEYQGPATGSSSEGEVKKKIWD